MAMFLNIIIDYSKSRDQINKLPNLCPVDIFAIQNDQVVVVDDQVDECTLCGRCTEGNDAVVIEKLYEK